MQPRLNSASLCSGRQASAERPRPHWITDVVRMSDQIRRWTATCVCGVTALVRDWVRDRVRDRGRDRGRGRVWCRILGRVGGEPVVGTSGVDQRTPQLFGVEGVDRDGHAVRMLVWADSDADASTRAERRGVAASSVRACEIPVRNARI